MTLLFQIALEFSKIVVCIYFIMSNLTK